MSKPKQSAYKYNLDTIFKFGKYKGHSIEYVMKTDPNYLHWCIEEVDGFELDNKTYALLPPRTEDDENDWPDLGWGDFPH